MWSLFPPAPVDELVASAPAVTHAAPCPRGRVCRTSTSSCSRQLLPWSSWSSSCSPDVGSSSQRCCSSVPCLTQRRLLWTNALLQSPLRHAQRRLLPSLSRRLVRITQGPQKEPQRGSQKGPNKGPKRSLKKTQSCSESPPAHTATTDDGISFDKAAGLKRFHSHSHQLHTFSHNAGWEGGLSKSRAVLFLIKIATTETARETLDPPTHQKQCKFVRLTPLRSVRHHNLAVNPARPPATTDDGISFDEAAGLKALPFALL